MSEEKKVRKNVADEVFAKAVRDSKMDNTGLKGISEKTGLAIGSVSTRLTNWRKVFGKDSVPTFRNNSQKRLDKEKLVAIMRGDE